MKNLFHDTEAFLFTFLVVFMGLMFGALPIFYDYQQEWAFQQNLNTVLECRKSVEIKQMDNICGPIPQRGDNK